MRIEPKARETIVNERAAGRLASAGGAGIVVVQVDQAMGLPIRASSVLLDEGAVATHR